MKQFNDQKNLDYWKTCSGEISLDEAIEVSSKNHDQLFVIIYNNDQFVLGRCLKKEVVKKVCCDKNGWTGKSEKNEWETTCLSYERSNFDKTLSEGESAGVDWLSITEIRKISTDS